MSHPAESSAVKSIAAATDSQVLLPASGLRKNFMLHNDSSAILYLTLGPGLSTTSSFTVAIPANWYYEPPMPGYVGAVTGAWASATGSARITELF